MLKLAWLTFTYLKNKKILNGPVKLIIRLALVSKHKMFVLKSINVKQQQ